MSEPTPPSEGSPWVPRLGFAVCLLAAAWFVWGLNHRASLAATDQGVIRMLFVPSVEQGTLVRRGDELARFIFQDTGLILRSEVPTSYAAVIQAIGSDQADVAWMPAFSYVITQARYNAKARLQVVRTVDRFAIVVGRSAGSQPQKLEELAQRRIAVPKNMESELRARIAADLDQHAPGWVAIEAESDRDAVRRLLEQPLEVDAAVSSYVFSGPHDLVGDGRKELEAERAGTLLETRILHTTRHPVAERATVYYGCIFSRVDAREIRRVEDLQGRPFAFSDETSTSGHIFPRMLMQARGVSLGHVIYAGGHAQVVHAVSSGKVPAGASFYSPPGAQQARDGTLVGDARMLVLKGMPDAEKRRQFLEELRVLALTDAIPNDVCLTRDGFSETTWERFYTSFRKFIGTDAGKEAYYDLVAGVDALDTSDRAFDGFRAALDASGMSAEKLLDAEEAKLRARKAKDKEQPKK